MLYQHPRKRIIGIDPGKTTGFCEVLLEDDGYNFHVVRTAAVSWDNRFTLQDLIFPRNAPSPDVVVMESFFLYEHAANSQIGHDFPSTRVIGTVEAWLHARSMLDRVHFQNASAMSRVAILPQHVDDVGPTQHERDAYKHIRYYIVRSHD